MMIYIRQPENLIQKHSNTWEMPCQIPRDADCCIKLSNSQLQSIQQFDKDTLILHYTTDGKACWSTASEVYITEPTELFGKRYVGNLEEVKDEF